MDRLFAGLGDNNNIKSLRIKVLESFDSCPPWGEKLIDTLRKNTTLINLDIETYTGNLLPDSSFGARKFRHLVEALEDNRGSSLCNLGFSEFPEVDNASESKLNTILEERRRINSMRRATFGEK